MYWVDCIVVREKVTRLQYYLQLRDNLLHFNQSVSEEKCFLLAGLALQADFGNFDHERHVGAYFDPREFFPAWVSQFFGIWTIEGRKHFNSWQHKGAMSSPLFDEIEILIPSDSLSIFPISGQNVKVQFIIETTRALGGVHVPLTKVFQWLTASVNETIVKPHISAQGQYILRIRQIFPT